MRKRAAVATLVVESAAVATALVCAAGAASKLVDPHPTFEVAQVVTGRPIVAGAIVGGGALVEMGVAGSVALRLLVARAAVMSGIALFSLFVGWLLLVRRNMGGEARCSCVAVLRDTTVAAALRTDVLVVAGLVAVLAFDYWVRRRAATARSPTVVA